MTTTELDAFAPLIGTWDLEFTHPMLDGLWELCPDDATWVDDPRVRYRRRR